MKEKSITQSYAQVKETTILIDSTNSLTDALKNIVRKIYGSMDDLYGLIGSTTDLANESSNSTIQISSAMNGLAETTEHMANSVQDINENALDMGNIVEEAQNTVSILIKSSGNMEKPTKMPLIVSITSSTVPKNRFRLYRISRRALTIQMMR